MNIKLEDLVDVNEFQTWLINLRRYFHRNPELSEMERETSSKICHILDDFNVPYRNNIAGYGIVAKVVDNPGPVIAVRADMDALPICEEIHREYSSSKVGIMHACGHDAHVAILLGLAKILSGCKDKLNGTILLVFQPAEETVGGALPMINSGAFSNPKPDYFLGLHVEPYLNIGQIGIKYGKMYAASDMFDITVHGRGSHGAHPDEGIDAICIASELLLSIQVMLSRKISPLNPAVCTFGKIDGGTVRNQVADKVKLEGIARTLDGQTRIFLRNEIGKICNRIEAQSGASIDFFIHESYDSLINDDWVTSIVQNTAESILGKGNVVIEEFPDLGCEDFSYFANLCPSCFFHLGCYDETLGPKYDLHNSQFDIDERCLIIGVDLQFNNILNIIENHLQR